MNAVSPVLTDGTRSEPCSAPQTAGKLVAAISLSAVLSASLFAQNHGSAHHSGGRSGASHTSRAGHRGSTHASGGHASSTSHVGAGSHSNGGGHIGAGTVGHSGGSVHAGGAHPSVSGGPGVSFNPSRTTPHVWRIASPGAAIHSGSSRTWTPATRMARATTHTSNHIATHRSDYVGQVPHSGNVRHDRHRGLDYHFPLVSLGFYSSYRSGYYSGWSSYYPPVYYDYPSAYYDYAPAYPVSGYYDTPLPTDSVPLYPNDAPPTSVIPEELSRIMGTEPAAQRAHEGIFISRPELPSREAPEALPEGPDPDSRRQIPAPSSQPPGAPNARGAG